MFVAGHVTFSRMDSCAPLLFGLGVTAQLVPFQRSMSVWTVVPFPYWPTAMQMLTPGHATPNRRLPVAPVGLGLATMAQLVPFQRSTNVPDDSPTAKQLVVFEHEMPCKSPPPLGVGLATIDQLVPFQRSTSVARSWVASFVT